MKKIKNILITFFVIGISILLYWLYHDSTFVKDNFVQYTGIKDFIVESQYFDNGQSFIKTIITTTDKANLQRKYQFLSTVNMAGMVQCPYFSVENKDYVYFLDNKRDGQYGYILYCLNKNDNTLVVYEYFGDH